MTKFFSLFLLMILFVGAGCVSRVTPTARENPSTNSLQDLKLTDGSYTLSTSVSSVLWEASKVKVTHTGKVDPKEGSVVVQNGTVISGEAVIDMTTIKNFDQEGKFLELLETHLRSEDFFAVENFPTAQFTLRTIEPLEGLEGLNYRVDGSFTIKGIEADISFPASITETESGYHLTARVSIDRTLYDIRYGSGKFFENLGDGLIADEFYLDVNLEFVKSE